MTGTLTHQGTLVIETCCHEKCNTPFAIESNLQHSLRESHATFYCPRGHGQSYVGKSDLELAREAQAAAERSARFARTSADAARDQARAAERSARAYRGHLTRARNKIANGVCPVGNCRRHFDNVQAHIQGEHPDWALAHDIEVKP